MPVQSDRSRDDRAHDIVLYGASGFVGKLTAAYLSSHAPEDARIALAGRSRGKLEAVRESVGGRAANWPILTADSFEPEAVAGMARSTRVVMTTVGPYAKYGGALVDACAEEGTHYADLTGEVLFVKESAARNHERAVASGARIVHSCGYDSVPSDLGVMMLHRLAGEEDSGELTDTVHKAWGRGGFSGGTIDSMRTQMVAVGADPSLRQVLADPYALSPDRENEPDVGPQPDVFAPRKDPLLGEWVAPFVMASFNTRIVRRTNALSGWSYGRRFVYREVMAFGSSPAGAAISAAVTGGLAAFAAGMAFPATRRLLDRILPAPGAGPSQKTLDNGYFRSELVTVTSSGRRLRSVIAAAGDPGYKATAVMLGESGLALAFDAERLPAAAGVVTPASAIGDALVGRLQRAGFEIDAGVAEG